MLRRCTLLTGADESVVEQSFVRLGEQCVGVGTKHQFVVTGLRIGRGRQRKARRCIPKLRASSTLHLPSGERHDQVAWPHIEEPHGFAIEVTDTHLAPHYRIGDLIVVSPREQPRRGDRVLLKTRAGEVMAMQVARATADSMELNALDGGGFRTIEKADLAWMHRIVWVSQ